jgi:hypothetical protein
MHDRRNAWITHAILAVSFLGGVGAWAVALSRQDHGSWHINSAIAVLGFGATATLELVVTLAVALWGRRPLHVVGLHLTGFAPTALLVVGYSVGG